MLKMLIQKAQRNRPKPSSTHPRSTTFEPEVFPLKNVILIANINHIVLVIIKIDNIINNDAAVM